MKQAAIIVAGLGLAGCMTVETPMTDILEHPIVADIEADMSREQLSACLHDTARSGPVWQSALFTIPMPTVNVVPRDDLTTDVTVQFFQDGWDSGHAALYRITGSAPVRVQLYWKWEAGADGAEARRTLRNAPHQWLDACTA